MSAQILTLLKFGLLALLYLFFARVLFSVWAELRPTGKRSVAPIPGAPVVASAAAAVAAPAPQQMSRRTQVSTPASRSSSVAGPDPFAPPQSQASPAQARSAQETPSPQLQGHLLVVEPDNLAGLTYELGNELTVGRAPGCGISLDDTFVSSLHARVFRHEGAYVLEDLGSTNGTFLNGGKVTEPTIMTMADSVRFGSMVLVLR